MPRIKASLTFSSVFLPSNSSFPALQTRCVMIASHYEITLSPSLRQGSVMATFFSISFGLSSLNHLFLPSSPSYFYSLYAMPRYYRICRILSARPRMAQQPSLILGYPSSIDQRYICIIIVQSPMQSSSQHITQPQPLIKYEAKGSFLTVTLNRPKALNSLNLDMVHSLTQNYDFINQHQVVWFQGAGGKAFCAGGDVKALFEKDATVDLRLNFFKNEFLLDYRIANLKALQISCWDGITMGGGAGISGFAPFIIATEKTVFAMPEVKIGFYTDVGFSYLLARLKNNIGYYLGLTGASLKGQQVYNAGIANYFIPSAKIAQVYQQIAKISSQPHENIKQLVADTLNKYHVAPKTKQLPHQDDIKYLFGLGSAKAIYQEALTQKNEFYSSIAKIFKTVCPVSVELVHRLITNAKNMNLKDTFILDYVILEHMAVNPDFREGVRSVLIEKGSIPKWSCQDLLQVKQEQVDYFFKPIQGSTPLKI